MLNSLKIPTKLTASFVLICTSAAIMIGVLFMALSMIGAAVEVKTQTNVKYNHLQTLEADLLRQDSQMRGFLLTGDTGYLKAYEGARQSYDKVSVDLENMLKIEKHRDLVRQSRQETEQWRAKWGDRLIAMARAGNREQAAAELRQGGTGSVLDSAIKPLEDVRADQTKFIAERTEQQNSAIATAKTALSVGGIILIAIAAAFALLLTRLIATPITQLTRTMSDLAGGNNDVTVPAVDRGDELGDMAKAVLVFRDAAIAKAKTDAAAREAEAVQKHVVQTVSSQLSLLAEGNLSARIDSDFPGEYAAVKSNFNDAMTSLREVISSVLNTTESIRTGSSEIAGASEDLARRTEANAANLEETAAAVTQMDDRLKTTAIAAGQTVERADGTIATVATGRSTADEAMQAMNRVADSAKGIDSVIEGLDKIAFQTRVLAMNAAVEAGRAGEAGKGFAVVADLVSALAMRSEEEAQSARERLTATQTDIVAAVDMVQRVDSALANISEDVSEVHQLLGQMASDNQAQSGAISEVRTTIDAMDQSTQQNAAMVEETSAAARHLASEVNVLAEQASRFTLGNETAKAVAAPRVAASAPKAPVKTVAMVKQANGSAASADWSSF